MREQLLDAAGELTGGAPGPEAWEAFSRSQPAQLLASGLVIMADWIASNQDLFPLIGDGPAAPDRVEVAMQRLALPAPLQLPPVPDQERVWRSAGIAGPRSLQKVVVDAVAGMDAAGLVLVEAPTGSGKTGAALAGAAVLAGRFGAGGLVYAMPSRATADAAVAPVVRWAREWAGGAAVSVGLAHGAADRHELYAGMPSSVYDDAGGGAVAHWWLTGRGKTALMSSVVICTIDQILLAGLSARHVMLRHLGLAGKVVVLDEIHASDVFMRGFLMPVLAWLGAYGVPVIALSATLPPAMREELAAAYERGRAAGRPADALAAGDEPPVPAGPVGYPMVTVTTPAGPRGRVLGPGAVEERQVVVDELPGGIAAIAAAAQGLADRGGAVAVVCATVHRAQLVAQELTGADGGPRVVVLHSRLLGPERAARERVLHELVGPNGERPAEGLVVVATQVIEQALDLDFDVMVSDVGPVDALVQRMGRVHRHDGRTRPAGMEVARVLLTGIVRGREPGGMPRFARGLSAVYGRAVLLRAVAVLDAHRAAGDGVCVVRSPGDVPGLVAGAVDPGLEVPAGWDREVWEQAMDALARQERSRRAHGRTFAVPEPVAGKSLLGWMRRQADLDGELGAAQVRDGVDAVEVVVVERGPGGGLVGCRWAAAGVAGVPVDGEISDAVARELAGWSLRLPGFLSGGSVRMSAGPVGAGLVDELAAGRPAGWQRSRWLRGMVPLVLDGDGGAWVSGVRVRYDAALGLLVGDTNNDEEAVS